MPLDSGPGSRPEEPIEGFGSRRVYLIWTLRLVRHMGRVERVTCQGDEEDVMKDRSGGWREVTWGKEVVLVVEVEVERMVMFMLFMFVWLEGYVFFSFPLVLD